MLSGQNRLLEALAELLRTGAEIVGSGTTRKRFEEMASFYEVTRHAIKATLDQWRAQTTAQPRRSGRGQAGARRRRAAVDLRLDPKIRN
jgi:hypothetical protein